MDDFDDTKTLHVPEVLVLGLRAIIDLSLVEARKGNDQLGSAHNDRWAMRCANSLRQALKWDMKTKLGDLPL